MLYQIFFFFQAEDGIRAAQESRGLGDVYKRQLDIQAIQHIYGTNAQDVTQVASSSWNAGTFELTHTGYDFVSALSPGDDIIRGVSVRDIMAGGSGNDRFVAAFGDGVDWVARPVDANGDNLWDTSGGLVVSGGLAWGQDFRPAAAATAGTTTLVVDLGTTVLNGVDTFVAVEAADAEPTIVNASEVAARVTKIIPVLQYLQIVAVIESIHSGKNGEKFIRTLAQLSASAKSGAFGM